MVLQVINAVVGNIPSIIYWQLKEKIPLMQGSVEMQSSSEIQVAVSGRSSIEKDVEIDETGIEEYVSSRPAKIKSYRRRTKTGIQHVESHTRGNPPLTLQKRVAKKLKKDKPPLQSVPINIEDILDAVVAESVAQIAERMRSATK